MLVQGCFMLQGVFPSYKPCGCLSALQNSEPRDLEKGCSTQCPPLPYTSCCTSQWFLTLEMILKHTLLPLHSSSLSSVFSSQDPDFSFLVWKLFLLFCLHVQSCPANWFMFLLFACNECQALFPVPSQFQLPGSLLTRILDSIDSFPFLSFWFSFFFSLSFCVFIRKNLPKVSRERKKGATTLNRNGYCAWEQPLQA